MIDLQQIKEIERHFGFIYPKSFYLKMDELNNLAETEAFKNSMPGGRFLTSVSDLQIAFKSDLPVEFIPFMLVEQAGFNDYYVFDTTTDFSDYEVAVFSSHALVHSWKNFDEFLQWLSL